MKVLKILSVISFLLINGLGEHGIPNFAGILISLYEFAKDIITLPHNYEISWGLGLFSIVRIVCLLIMIISKKYRDRYLFLISFITLIALEIYSSGVLSFHKMTFWFLFPLLLFITSSIMLIVIHFKKQKD